MDEKEEKKVVAIVSWIYLVILGLRDLKKRSVPVCWLIAGAVLMAVVGIYNCGKGEQTVFSMLVGVIPGLMLCLLARATGKIGMADGILLLELGVGYGYRKAMILLCGSLFLLALVSILLMMSGKVKKNSRVPLFPALAMVFFLVEIGG